MAKEVSEVCTPASSCLDSGSVQVSGAGGQAEQGRSLA